MSKKRPVPSAFQGIPQVLGAQFYGMGSIALGSGYNMNTQPGSGVGVVPTGGYTEPGAGAVAASDMTGGPAATAGQSFDSGSAGEFAAGLDAGGVL